MRSIEGELLVKIDPDVDSDIVRFVQEAMKRDFMSFSKNNHILSHEHVRGLDTVSITERFTNATGFFKAIGVKRSQELADRLHSLVVTEKKIKFEIAQAPHELLLVYADLLRKIAAYASEADSINKKIRERRQTSINSLREKMEGYVLRRIESYKVIDPDEAKETTRRFNEARTKLREVADVILANTSLSESEQTSQYENALDAYFLRLNII